jgi:hypothetical protein
LGKSPIRPLGSRGGALFRLRAVIVARSKELGEPARCLADFRDTSFEQIIAPSNMTH